MDRERDPIDGDEPGVPPILRDLAGGRLTDDEVDAVVAWLMADGGDDVPPWVVNRAVRIASQATAGRAPQPTLLRRLVAVLVHDTRLRPRASGARSPGVDRPRLLYEAGGVEVDLEVGEGSSPGRLRLLGQVTAAQPDLARAWVAVDGPAGHREATVDDLGQFALDGFAAGIHRLELGLARVLIEVPDLQL
jgi:hypothetical protein